MEECQSPIFAEKGRYASGEDIGEGRYQHLKMGLLPGAFLLLWGSAFGATAHDAVHGAAPDAFMTLPPYNTRTREGHVHQLSSGPKPCRLGLGVRKCSQVDFLIVEHRSVLHSREGDFLDAYS